MASATNTNQAIQGQAADEADNYCDWKAWGLDSFGRPTRDSSKYFDVEIAPFLKELSQPHVLELGFGNGEFLGWCLENGFKYCGLESNPILVTRARDFGATAFASIKESALPPATFNCVVAIDVLEHISHAQLREIFKELHDATQPGGYFIARFPNGDSPLGRPYQHGDITHVTTIGSLKLSQIAKATGWNLVSVGAPKIPLEGTGLLTKAKIKAGLACRALIEKAASTLYYSGQKIHFSPNCIAVLQRNK